MHCIFCEDINENILVETAHFKVVFDIDPIQPGHLLILSKEHYMDLRELPNLVVMELLNIEKRLIEVIESNFSVDGVSIIQNNGAIMDEGTHFHVHVVPRYRDDEFWEHQVVKEYPIAVEKMKELLQAVDWRE